MLDSGYWDVVLRPRLVKDGKFCSVDGIGARHTGSFAYGYYLRQRYLLSRNWGGAQKDRVPAWIAYAWAEWLGYLCAPGHALEEVE